MPDCSLCGHPSTDGYHTSCADAGYDRFYMVGWDSSTSAWYATLDSPSWAEKHGWPPPIARGLSHDAADVFLSALACGIAPGPDDSPDDDEPAALIRLRETAMKPWWERSAISAGPPQPYEYPLAKAVQCVRDSNLPPEDRIPVVQYIEQRLDIAVVVQAALEAVEATHGEQLTAPVRARFDRGERSRELLAEIRRL